VTKEEDAAERERQLAETVAKALQQLKEIAEEGGLSVDE
jgi:hypothetical protein